MSDARELLERELTRLRGVRDELKVQLHLGRSEVRDQWEKLEKAWEHAEGRLRLLKNESSESATEIREAAKLLVDEIREGYRHLRQLL